MIAVFPEPPARVLQAMHNLAIVQSGDTTKIQQLGLDLDRLPRPWEAATCDRRLRRQLWEWCESVVAWINSDYMWRATSMIPACWPQHPQLTHELPVLACLRWAAEETTRPEPLEEWHRVTLPAFLDRLTQRLDKSTCLTTGKHEDWPGRARYQAYSSASAVEQRQAHFHADTAQRASA